MTILGYARVSTRDQNLSAQLEALKAAGAAKVYREKISGARAHRPQLAKLMEALQPGDSQKLRRGRQHDFAAPIAPPTPGIRTGVSINALIGGPLSSKAELNARYEPFNPRPEQTLDVWSHLRFGPRESYRELRLELLCCPHRLGRGTAPHEREYPRRKDRF